MNQIAFVYQIRRRYAILPIIDFVLVKEKSGKQAIENYIQEYPDKRKEIVSAEFLCAVVVPATWEIK